MGHTNCFTFVRAQRLVEEATTKVGKKKWAKLLMSSKKVKGVPAV